MTGRDTDFIERYRRGETLEEIARDYGITRERVRQRLAKHGISRNCGGVVARRINRTIEAGEARKAKAESRCMRNFGVSMGMFYDIAGHYFVGDTRRKRDPITYAYLNQKADARRRGIEWQFNLASWWTVWRESGKWSERGRGAGYCMARWADDGPYSPENVYICTISQNFKDSYIVRPMADRIAKRNAKRAHEVSQ